MSEPQATPSLCQNCLRADICPNCGYSQLTAPLRQLPCSSNNQSNVQFGEPVDNTTYAPRDQWSNNNQVNSPCTPLTNTTYPPTSPNFGQLSTSTARVVGSPAIAAAAYKRSCYAARFQCPLATCNRTFTTKHNLDSHERAHLGIRQFRCNSCGSAFTKKGDLARHFKSQKHYLKTRQAQVRY
ncbi:hypothetical protein AB1N83_012207 [Pleurotus pulmonarius]